MLSKNIRSMTALHPRRFFHSSSSVLSKSKAPAHNHNQDSYNREVDPTPPPDSSIHRVDPSSDNVQKPHEPPSGEWSRAGTKTSEYQSMSKTEPYAAPGQDKRYGGKEMYSKDKGPETSKPRDGPEGKASEGRKPEGR
jgi:hypothetical protein